MNNDPLREGLLTQAVAMVAVLWSAAILFNWASKQPAPFAGTDVKCVGVGGCGSADVLLVLGIAAVFVVGMNAVRAYMRGAE